MSSILSKRVKVFVENESELVKAHFKCAEDIWSEKNPSGYINLGTAENDLMDQENKTILDQCSVRTEYLHYKELHGIESLRTHLADFLGSTLNTNIISDNIIVSTGASAVLEMLSYALMDRGEKAITIAPYYTGFKHDISVRFENELVLSHVLNEDGEVDFEAFEKQIQSTSNLRVLLFCNPHNPTGKSFSKEEVCRVIEIAKKYHLEIISDEIYAHSLLPDKSFISTHDDTIDSDYREHIHIVYGMAKDFGISGVKVGILYSKNKLLIKAILNQAYFHPLSTVAQMAISKYFEDKVMLDKYLTTYRSRLAKHSENICQFLDSLD
ncbi:pyridoxal phosphate-dependent aminotransferase, partial [Bacteriovoracaceae bacterium]|nr:pyridoxal phosphate-dependent aminotransferase [Bacteriovoracaceae bacterium]